MPTIKNKSAEAAKGLKKELTKAFPKTKFSVKSSVYSGGSSVDVRWTFGATVEQIERFSARRQHGKFNSMEDIYEYTGSGMEVGEDGNMKEVASAKYVSEERNVRYEKDSYKTRKDVLAIYAQIADMFNYTRKENEDYQPEIWNGVADTASNRYYRIVNECSFVSDNVELIKVEYSENVTGFEPFTIWYKDLNTGKTHSGKRFTTNKY